MGAARIYLDFDGVVNQLGLPGDADSGWPEHRETRIPVGSRSFPIRWAPALVERLAALPADIVWLTTWRSATARFPAKIGTPEWLWLDWEPTDFGSGYLRSGKGAALEAHLAEHPADGPAIWIDDDLALYPTAVSLADRLGVRRLSPDPKVGITPSQMGWIEGICRR